jgi:hypothetical protein
MSVDLLVRDEASVKPKLVVRDVASMYNADVIQTQTKSKPFPLLRSFTLNSILVQPARESVDDSLRLSKRSDALKSMRALAAMFLALTYVRKAPIVVATRRDDFSLVLLRQLFPDVEFVVFFGDALEPIYNATVTSVWERSGEKPYLISLGTSIAKHEALIAYFKPVDLLLGLDVENCQDFKFYGGEAWYPPFAGYDTKILYLRTSTENDVEMWQGNALQQSLREFIYMTNESVVYFDPQTGTDRYLFGSSTLPNDYTHLFCYWLVREIYHRLKRPCKPELHQHIIKLLAS